MTGNQQPAQTPQRKTYLKTCQRCGEDFRTYRNYRRPVTCHRKACADADAAEHNAAVETYHAEQAARPRTPRRPRTIQPLYGDYAWVAVVNGIDPKTGRKRQETPNAKRPR